MSGHAFVFRVILSIGIGASFCGTAGVGVAVAYNSISGSIGVFGVNAAIDTS